MVRLQVMILINLPVTNIQRCFCHNMKTFRLYHLQLLHVSMGSRCSVNAYRVHHKINGLFTQQNTTTDMQATFAINDRSLNAPSPDYLPSDFSQPVQLYIKHHPNIPSCIEPM